MKASIIRKWLIIISNIALLAHWFTSRGPMTPSLEPLFHTLNQWKSQNSLVTMAGQLAPSRILTICSIFISNTIALIIKFRRFYFGSIAVFDAF